MGVWSVGRVGIPFPVKQVSTKILLVQCKKKKKAIYRMLARSTAEDHVSTKE